MKPVEGTQDAPIRKIVWGVPIATMAIGLLILLFACLQPSYTATGKEVGETAYTPSTTMVIGHSSSYYSVMLEVEYTNEQGAPETTTVHFGSTNPNSLPKVGDQLQVSHGLTSMVTHPNRDLIGVGNGAAGIGRLFLILLLLTMWRDRKRVRSLSHKSERNS